MAFFILSLGIIVGGCLMADPLMLFNNNINVIIGIIIFLVPYFIYMIYADIMANEKIGVKIIFVIFTLISTAGLTLVLLGCNMRTGIIGPTDQADTYKLGWLFIIIGLPFAGLSPFGGRNPVAAGSAKLYKYVVHLIDTH